MVVSGRKIILWLCLGFTASIAPHNGAFAASDGPNPLMKGIQIISYMVFLEKTVGGDRCKIDWDNLNTSLQFVANQSTTLKIVTEIQKSDQTKELYSKLDPKWFFGSDGDQKKYQATKKVADEYISMPNLLIGFSPLQTQGGCAGTITARLTASVSPTHLLATQVDVYDPHIEIWSKTYGFVGPQESFSNYAINLGEQMMKSLVNDWAASQR
jgi:hypothetical protein